MKTRLRIGMMLRGISIDHGRYVMKASIARIYLVFGVRERRGHDWNVSLYPCQSWRAICWATFSQRRMSQLVISVVVVAFPSLLSFYLATFISAQFYALSLSLPLRPRPILRSVQEKTENRADSFVACWGCLVEEAWSYIGFRRRSRCAIAMLCYWHDVRDKSSDRVNLKRNLIARLKRDISIDEDEICCKRNKCERSRERNWSARTHTRLCRRICSVCREWSTNGSVTSRSYQMNELDDGQIDIQSTLYWTLSYTFLLEERGKKKTPLKKNKRKIRWIIDYGLV